MQKITLEKQESHKITRDKIIQRAQRKFRYKKIFVCVKKKDYRMNFKKKTNYAAV